MGADDPGAGDPGADEVGAGGLGGSDAEVTPPLTGGMRDGAADVGGSAGMEDATGVTVRPEVGALGGGGAAEDVVFAASADELNADDDTGAAAETADVTGLADEPEAAAETVGGAAEAPAGDVLPPAGTFAGDAVLEDGGAAAPDDPGGLPPLAEGPELGGGDFGVMGAGPTARLDLDV